jgi:hypothetical protein
LSAEQVERFNWERLESTGNHPSGHPSMLTEPASWHLSTSGATRDRNRPGHLRQPARTRTVSPTPPAAVENELTAARTETLVPPAPGLPTGGTNGPRLIDA